MSTLIANLTSGVPSRELDARIAERIYQSEKYTSIVKDLKYDYAIRYWPGGPSPEYTKVPFYTKSIDAALRLIPNGWVTHIAIYDYAGQADMRHPAEPYARHVATAKTAAIAICIAALKILGD